MSHSATPLQCDVLVIGDEVESILTAVSAARAGVKVVLVRRSTGRYGGLSVRGGLSYMDITPEFVTGLFSEFLKRTELVRVALNPEKAHETLSEMLNESGITVISGVETLVELNEEGFPERALLQGEHDTWVVPTLVIDATPDADVMRTLGVPYLMGLGGLLGESQNFLGVSPVFRVTGVSVEGLQSFEASLRQRADIETVLTQALPYHPPALRAEYVTRPTYAPSDMDYLDILSPVIGIYYHIWRHGDAASYAEADIAIDGFNISRLQDGSLGLNGLVAKPSALEDISFEDLLAMSQGGPIPEVLREEMTYFERFLREEGQFADACVIPPEEMYVRQTLTLLSKDNMTARKAIEGGVSADKAIGTFSYWLDLRGAQLWKHFPGTELPKPVFNVGLDVALPLAPNLQNIGFIGRSAGYSPIGQGTGRIVQHNAMLGEGLGIAAALAALSRTTLDDIAETAMPQIQAILKSRRGGCMELSGHPVWTAEESSNSLLLQQDEIAIQNLRQQAADLSIL